MLGEGPPDFTNEQGVKWWRDLSTTQYLRAKGLQGAIFLVEDTEKVRTRVLIQNGEMVYEQQNLEQLAVHIDILALNSPSKGKSDAK
jgi:alpha-glucosidase (family GH31 glycosyl hydrolase)